MSGYPPGVQKMINALKMLNGISDIEVDLQGTDEYSPDTLSLPGLFALLPHLVLRRSGGGMENEALVSFEFRLKRDEHGWIALEFLAWWVRDMCRSGHDIQLRPLAYPPSAGDEIQLGNSLSFLLEFFVIERDNDAKKIAEFIGECGSSLMSSIQLYGDAIKHVSPKNGLFGLQ